LPPANRMRRSRDFATVIRCGDRARRDCLVVHHYRALDPDPASPRVGLVVGRGIGGSVVRHRVSRQLRAQLQARLGWLPPGSGTVVRALPPAATADSGALGSALDAALGRVGVPAATGGRP
jgi:ribonuclease P protein component